MTDTSSTSPSIPQPLPSRWTARIGLAVVAGILVSCFGLLIAASHASSAAL